MAAEAMAAATAAAGWRGLDQHAVTKAIPVAKQPDGVHLQPPQYTFVLQHIAHYLPLSMQARSRGQWQQ